MTGAVWSRLISEFEAKEESVSAPEDKENEMPLASPQQHGPIIPGMHRVFEGERQDTLDGIPITETRYRFSVNTPGNVACNCNSDFARNSP